MRLFRSSVVFFAFILPFIVWGQTPQMIKLAEGAKVPDINDIDFRYLACTDQFAGTISLVPQTGQSNDMSSRRIFLCKNDSIKLIGNRDYNLTGDPQTASLPGIAYAFYRCAPTVNGPNLASILTDPCIQGNPSPPPTSPGIWIYADPNSRFGDATFRNLGLVQSTFNSNLPYELFFAPITVDEAAINGYESTGGGPAGPCVNVNTAQKFSVVYLNELTITNLQKTGALTGNFVIGGGLSQFDNSTSYNITIERVGNPLITGSIIGGPYKHNQTVNFSVPSDGTYTITVEDGKSCGVSSVITFNSAKLTLNIGAGIGNIGEEVCIPITAQNFNLISSMQYGIHFNSSLLEYTGVTFPSPLSINIDEMAFNKRDPNIINVAWFTGTAATVPDNGILFNVCFKILGFAGGQCNTISFGGLHDNGPIEFTGGNPEEIITEYTLNPGTICIDPNNLVIFGKSCSTTTNQGSFTIIPGGGVAPYNYNWAHTSGTPSGSGSIPTSGGSFVSPSNLAAGNYNVTVTDAGGLKSTTTITIVNAAPIFVSLSTIDPTCFGMIDGTVSVSSVGGGDVSSPYKIIWSTGTRDTINITNLGSGAYTVTIEDASGCSQTASAVLGVTPIVFPSPSLTQPSCLGSTDGAIRVTAFGGKPYTTPFNGYKYIWQSKTDSGISGNLTGVGPGTYRITVQDKNNCAKIDSFVLTPTREISIAFSSANPKCYNDRNGSIVISPLSQPGPGSPPYNYRWSPSTGLVSPQGLTATVTNLPAGQYSITVTDQVGCISSTLITIRNPDSIRIFELELKNLTCNGNGMDGKIHSSASGGTLIGNPLQYTFNWTGPNNFNQSGKNILVIDNLREGIYNLTITDDYGCKSSKSYSLGNVGASIKFDTIPPKCKNFSDGAINTTITYAKPYTLRWNNGSTAEDLSNLKAGKFIVTITANDGCITIDSVTIHDPLSLNIENKNVVKPRCYGTKTGSIAITVSTPFPLVDFVWSDPSIGNLPFASPLNSGTYYVTMTDKSTCPSIIDTIVIPDAPKIVFNFTNIDSVSCYNTCDGRVRLTPTKQGLTPSALYSYEWSKPFSENNKLSSYVTGLCPGYQRVQVTDSLGCRQEDSVLISAPTKIILDSTLIIINDASCNGSMDGRATVNALGGTPPYQFIWPASGNQISSTIGNLKAGRYPISIVDSKNCAILDSISIGQPDTLLLKIDSTNTRGLTCFERNDAQIFVIHSGGNPGPPITYNWSPNLKDTTQLVVNLAPNTYSVTITDSKGCTSRLSHTIPDLLPIEFNLSNIIPPVCNGDNTNIGVVFATGGSGGPFSFAVDFGPQTLLTNELPISAGPHTISIYDINGCSADTIISVTEPPALLVDLGPDAEIELGDSLQLVPIISSVNQISRLIWSPTATLNCTNPGCNSPYVRPLRTTEYTLEVVDTLGCRGLDRVIIRVDKNRNVYIPNVFSPNRDGRNDYFEIFTGKGVRAIPQIQIFDRWGNLLNEKNNLPVIPYGLEIWDGKFQGKEMQPGVYVYLIKVTFEDDQTLLYRGDITIVK